MPLDPEAQALLDAMEAQGLPPFEEMSVPQARDVVTAFRDLQGEPQEVAQVHDVLADGPAGQLPVRVYVPEGNGALPLLVYFHGGGWVIGNVEVADRPCRALANATGCVVASVEYRLAPETQFPGPLDDCYAATKWLAEHAGDFGADPARVGVAGDSAGGNLAAAVTLVAKEKSEPRLDYQLLMYPVTAPEKSSPHASYEENADGYLLTRKSMEWFWNMYVPSETQQTNPHASPLHAPDLSGLPQALVVTCEFDPLRDEGAAYASALEEAGVPVKSLRYEGQIHGIFWMGGAISCAQEMMSAIGEHVRQTLSTSTV